MQIQTSWVTVLCGALACGCAASTYETGECDPTVEPCHCNSATDCPTGWACGPENICIATLELDAGVEAAVPDQAVAPPDIQLPDTMPKKQFGESCNDKAECESGICIFAGVGGICSRTCFPGNCPPGFGCIGVLDAIEQGKVSDVCVPETTQLCTPCTAHTECSLSGKDLCLEYDPGELYCGQDCSKIGCPTGYTCDSVQVGTATHKQCVPQSGACDCDAGKVGNTKACVITTPFGDCAGTRSCQGATGWGTCEPPTTADAPDGAYIDDNCDGIDGDINGGIFVATAGADTTGCGLTHQDPCLTIGHGILRATTESRTFVYLQTGSYDEVVALAAGVHIIGGYDTSWTRGPRNKTAHKVTITGDLDTTTDQYLTVRAHNLAAATTMADLVLVGPNATGANAKGTRSSHVLHADTVANLNLERVTLIAGNGANGAMGALGLNAPIVTPTSIMHGAIGGNGVEEFSTCDSSTRGTAGAAGTNSCPGTTAVAGGAGGRGGTMDTCCDCILGACTCVTCNCAATNGETGNNGAQSSGVYGWGGTGGAGSSCGPGLPGKSGQVQNGPGGQSGAGGVLTLGFWYAKSGTAGDVGDHGGGGGGGGGSGGCDSGTDSSGAGGGGGGAGGCAALSGGGAGAGGGGSFGILADAATITISDCEIQLGNGGLGGKGGNGGQGQSGGKGEVGGLGGSGASDGGDGGSGGHGGHGGGGGGGAGGVAYGIFSHKSNILQKCTFSGGSSGTGGTGGQSAPTAPVAERDGTAGQDGTDAPQAADTATCADPADCN